MWVTTMHWGPRLSKTDRESSSIHLSADWVLCDPASSSCTPHAPPSHSNGVWLLVSQNTPFLLGCPGCALLLRCLSPMLSQWYEVPKAATAFSVPGAWRIQQVPVAFSVFSSFQWDFAYFHFLNFSPV